MADRKVLLCLYIVLSIVLFAECEAKGGGRGGSRGGSRGSSRGRSSYSSSGRGWGSSISRGSSYGSHSSSGSSSKYKPLSSGISEQTSFIVSGIKLKRSHPGRRPHKYPPSLSGISGSGTSYQPSSSGTSSHNYPPSLSGISGTGSNYKPPPSSGIHYYPPATSVTSKPYYSSSGGTWSNNYSPGYGSGTHHHGGIHTNYYVPPTYYSSPQHVYITEYRNSGSRYSDLLTGLTLYNMGRSHSHYHDHYYHDDYYVRRYSSYSSNQPPSYVPQDRATCALKIKENGREDSLWIPCEIVSTFTDGSKKVDTPQTFINSTVCTTNTTVVQNTSTLNATQSNTVVPATNASSVFNITTTSNEKSAQNVSSSFVQSTTPPAVTIFGNGTVTFNNGTTISNFTLSPNVTAVPAMKILANRILISEGSVNTLLSSAGLSNIASNLTFMKNGLNVSTTPATTTVSVPNPMTTQSNVTTVNVTVCKNIVTAKDPLSVKGPPVSSGNMECAVEIQTKDGYLRNEVDCKVLMSYAKMPEPKKENERTGILPERQKLMTWLANPPWWLFIMIAV